MTTFIKIGAFTVNSEDYSFPMERTFRDAWTFENNIESGIISVDMFKARDIWRDKIRAARIPEFERLDAEFMKAMEIPASMVDSDGNSVRDARLEEIIVAKQALRDATADIAIEQAMTPDELKLVQPAGLKVE